MNNNTALKPLILNYLNNEIDKKIQSLIESIKSAKESRDNETKSSVGDKYETGRAMVQMELEKNQALLNQTENLKSSLSRIDIDKVFKRVEFGSFVETSQGNYCISIAYGKVKFGDQLIFCISPVSPLGKILEGKKADEKVIFNGKEILIRNIF